MQTFLSFINKKENIFLEFMEVGNFQPLNGIWKGNNKHSYARFTYSFDVEGDDCKDLIRTNPGDPDNRCYKISFSGSFDGSISVAFYRGESTNDSGKNVQINLGKSILYAFNEFVKNFRPEGFNWHAVAKTRSSKNSNARSKIYNAFFVENYFPHMYVPDPREGNGRWISRKQYDTVYVPSGLPEIPELNSRKSKKEFIEKIKSSALGANLFAKEFTDRRDNYRHAEELKRRQENESFDNYKNLKFGDLVYFTKDENIYEKTFKVPKIGTVNEIEQIVKGKNITDKKIIVKIMETTYPEGWERKYSTTESEYDEVSKIDTPEQAINKQEEFWNYVLENYLLKQKKLNPDFINFGDRVVYFDENRQEKFKGKIIRFEFSSNISGHHALLGHVEFDDMNANAHSAFYRFEKASLNVYKINLKNLYKDDETLDVKIQQNKKQKEIEKKIAKNKNIQNRRSRRSNSIVNPSETSQSFIDHPENSLNLRIGDNVLINASTWNRVNYRRRRRGRIPTRDQKGIILNFSLEGSTLLANVKNTRTEEMVWVAVRFLTKDESLTTQRVANRQSTQQQLIAAISNSNIQIGDSVRITRGRHSGKSGRILNFRMVNGNPSAIIASVEENRNFIIKIDYLQISNVHEIVNLNFLNFLNIIESFHSQCSFPCSSK